MISAIRSHKPGADSQQGPYTPGLKVTSRLALAPAEVHIWLASLEQPAAYRQQLSSLLTEDEQRRAARFHFEKDRHHFVVARGLLRTLLACYLDLPAQVFRFRYTSYGKPVLAEPERQPELNFNLSHSHEHVLYAFTYGREVGVDLEYIRPLANEELLLLAQRLFASEEYTRFVALPEGARLQAFFTCWTRKEAYLKACGRGLSLSLRAVDVSGAHIPLLDSGERSTSTCWSYCTPPVPPAYAAAVLAEGSDWEYHYSQWPQSTAGDRANADEI